MYALLEAIEDGEKNKILCFFSEKDAEKFKKFVNIYMLESGAGNGYGAYWVFTSAEIIQCNKIPGFAAVQIEEKLLRYMLRSILVARTASYDLDTIKTDLFIGKQDNAILFHLVGKLPPRQRPKVGDMFRVINRKKRERLEGRVINDLGDVLEVISNWDEGDDGQPVLKAKIIKVKVSDVMKIDDWKKRIRQESAMH